MIFRKKELKLTSGEDLEKGLYLMLVKERRISVCKLDEETAQRVLYDIGCESPLARLQREQIRHPEAVLSGDRKFIVTEGC